MIFKIFFNQNFEKLINDLGITEFNDVIGFGELAAIRDYTKNVSGSKPEEAAARAFRDLVILNNKIPIEQRLEKGLEKIGLLKLWHFDGKVNIDLHLNIKASIEQLVSEYVGEQYENIFHEGLKKYGVIIPIEHDTLRRISLALLYGGKKSNKPPLDAAHKFYMDIIVKNSKQYSSCVQEDAKEVLQILASTVK